MPNPETELETLFSGRSIVRGNERYFSPQVAREYIDACLARGLVVMGAEAFELRGKELIPRMDLIADFSTDMSQTWEELHEQANQASRRFVEALQGQQLLVNLTVLSRSEWESSQ